MPIQIGKIDPRLKTKSRLKTINHGLVKSPPPPGVNNYPPPPPNVNLKREKVPLSDAIDQAYQQKPPQSPSPQPQPQPQPPQSPQPQPKQYTVEKAHKAIEGIISKWMQLAGQWPEGKQRHNFMEIGERLREIAGVLQRDFMSSQLQEQIKGLPDTMDPYAPSTREQEEAQETADTPSNTNENPEDPEKAIVGPEEGPEEGQEEGQENLDAPEEIEKLDTELGLQSEPKLPTWTTTNTKNKKDIVIQRDDGFKLRIRKMNIKPRRWIAQLWTKNKTLDKGFIDIPPNTDPTEYTQKIADYILDKDSERYKQRNPKEYPVQDYGTQEYEPTGDLGTDEEHPSDMEIEQGEVDEKTIKRMSKTM